MGDLNLPNVNWHDTTTHLDENCGTLVDILSSHGLEQLNHNPSRESSANILDLIFCNAEGLISNVETVPNIFSSDHHPLSFRISSGDYSTVNTTKLVYCWTNVDYVAMEDALFHLNLHDVVSNAPNINEAWLAWKQNILDLVALKVPCYYAKTADNPP